jgi:hypothetical protein
LATVRNENDASAWRPINDSFQALQSLGASVLVVHHARKDAEGEGAYRGSQMLSVQLDTLLGLRRAPCSPEAGPGTAFTIGFEKARDDFATARDDWIVSFTQPIGRAHQWSIEKHVALDLEALVERTLASEFAGYGAAAKAFGVSKSDIMAAFTEAYDMRLVSRKDVTAAMTRCKSGWRSRESGFGADEEF